MSYTPNTFADQMTVLQNAYTGAEKNAKLARIVTWVAGTATLGYLILLAFHLSSQLWLIYELPTTMVWIESIHLAMPAIIGLLTVYIAEIHRSTHLRLLQVARLGIDIRQGVFDAIREYLGLELTEYAQYLETLNLAEELWQISNGMSENYQRAFLTTTKALETLEHAGGLAGIKQELLKSAALSRFIKDLMNLFSQHPDVLEAAQFDEAVTTVVTDFEARLEQAKAN